MIFGGVSIERWRASARAGVESRMRRRTRHLGPASWQNPKNRAIARTRSRAPAASGANDAVRRRGASRAESDRSRNRLALVREAVEGVASAIAPVETLLGFLRVRARWPRREGRNDGRIATPRATSTRVRARYAAKRRLVDAATPRHPLRASASPSRGAARGISRRRVSGETPERRKTLGRVRAGCAQRDATDGTARARRARVKFVSSVGGSRTMLLEVLCATCNRKEGECAASSAILRRGETRPERWSDFSRLQVMGIARIALSR